MAEKRKADESIDGTRKVPRTEDDSGRSSGADAEPNSEEFLQLFQKEAMWRQLQAYKRDSQTATETAKMAQTMRERSDQQLGLLVQSLAQLQDEIRSTLSTLSGYQTGKPTLPARGKGPFNKLVEGLSSGNFDQSVVDVVKQSQGLLHELRSAIQVSVSTWDTWTSKIERLTSAEEKQNEVVRVYEREVTRLQAERDMNRDMLDELQDQNRVLASEASSAKMELNRTKKSVAELEQNLANTRNKLNAAEKKLDRLRCETTAAPAVNKDAAVKPESSSSDVKVEGDSAGLLKIREDLAEARGQAEARSRTIQQLEEEKKRLQDDLHEALSKFANTEEKPDRDGTRGLWENYSFVKAELEASEAHVRRLNKELEELRAGGSKLRKQIETEEAARRKAVEADKVRLEADVNRLRAGRDAAQQELEIRKSKDNTETLQNTEIRHIANTRKDRIDALVMENQRLRMKVAAISGSREMVNLFDQLAAEDDPVSKVQSLYAKTLAQVEELRKLATSLGASASQLEKILGSTPEPTVRDGDLEAQIKQLELRCEQYEKTEKRLSDEIDTIANAWSQLEDQNSRKVLELAGKEDEIVRLHADKAKLEAKLGTAMKQHSTLNNSVLALKKQSDRQLEQIRRMEDLEKTLSQQIAHLEREISGRQGLIDGQKRKNAELALQVNEYRERSDKITLRLGEIVGTVKEKTAALDQEMRARREVEEKLAQQVKKLEVVKSDPSGDAELQRQLDEYKRLLKCTTCNNRFKSHVLLKCMHPFCKQCIDTVYESRQRKCPTCGIPFGQSDIKQVFL